MPRIASLRSHGQQAGRLSLYRLVPLHSDFDWLPATESPVLRPIDGPLWVENRPSSGRGREAPRGIGCPRPEGAPCRLDHQIGSSAGSPPSSRPTWLDTAG